MIIFLSLDLYLIFYVIIWGLILGVIYSLLALGLNIIFGVMKVVNFAHGEIMIIGAFTTYFISSYLNIDPFLIIPIAMIIAGVLGMGIERGFFKPIKNSSKLNEIFISIALILIIQNALVEIVLSINKEVKPVSMITQLNNQVLSIGSFNLPYSYVVVLVSAAIFLTAFYFLITNTRFGRILRAVSQNRTGAMLMGINVEMMDTISFAIGAALAALGGGLFGILYTFDVYSGTLPAIKAFAIIILGGLGSIPGAIIGGLILGVAENSAAVLLGGAWKDAIAFIFLTIILILKPSGIFGKE